MTKKKKIVIAIVVVVVLAIVFVVLGLLNSKDDVKKATETAQKQSTEVSDTDSQNYIPRTDPEYDKKETERIKEMFKGDVFLKGKYACSFIAEDGKQHTAYFDFKDDSNCEFDGQQYYYTIKDNKMALTSIYTDNGNPMTMKIVIADDQNSFRCLDGIHANRTFKKVG